MRYQPGSFRWTVKTQIVGTPSDIGVKGNTKVPVFRAEAGDAVVGDVHSGSKPPVVVAKSSDFVENLAVEARF